MNGPGWRAEIEIEMVSGQSWGPVMYVGPEREGREGKGAQEDPRIP